MTIVGNAVVSRVDSCAVSWSIVWVWHLSLETVICGGDRLFDLDISSASVGIILAGLGSLVANSQDGENENHKRLRDLGMKWSKYGMKTPGHT